MIAYFPEIYPDELVYSWFCRCYVHSGYNTHKAVLEELLYKKCNNPSKEFLGHLNSDTQRQIQKIYPIKNLILEHTMFSQYGRFIPLEQKKKAMYHLEFDFCDTHHLFTILPREETDLFMKYCPLCANEDRQQYGETYWHRKHQIRGVTVCYKHGCMLENSNVTAKSEQTFTLCPADKYAVKNIAKASNNSMLQSFTEYITSVFDTPIDFTADVSISSIIYHAITNTKYMSPSGRTRNTRQLTEDLQAFYKSMEISNIASISQIQRTLLGDRFDFSVICQIAFFLRISVNDLTNPPLTKEQIQKEQESHYMKGKIPLNWNTYDNETAPLLEQFASDVYSGVSNDVGRPERVSKRLVYHEFQLDAHRLSKMPKCREILKRYSESYEENWARRIVWAYNKLKTEQENKPFYWSDIRTLSGVKKENIENIIPYVRKYVDNSTYDMILQILKYPQC